MAPREREYTTDELADALDRLQRQHDSDIDNIRRQRSDDINMVSRSIERIQTDYVRFDTYKARHDRLRADLEKDTARLESSIVNCRNELDRLGDRIRAEVTRDLAELDKRVGAAAALAKASIFMIAGTVLTALIAILMRVNP